MTLSSANCAERSRACRPLLRFISDPQLRQQVTAAINKVEAFNGYSAWLRFGGEVIERNDPAEQQKILKSTACSPTA